MAHRPIISLEASGPYRAFPLALPQAHLSLLPDGHELQVNTESGCFIIVNWSAGYFAGDGIFSLEALPLLLVLLNHWPSYVPHQKLLHALENVPADATVPGLDNEEQRLERVHHLIRISRPLLEKIGITIQDVDDLGYKLGRSSESPAESRG